MRWRQTCQRPERLAAGQAADQRCIFCVLRCVAENADSADDLASFKNWNAAAVHLEWFLIHQLFGWNVDEAPVPEGAGKVSGHPTGAAPALVERIAPQRRSGFEAFLSKERAKRCRRRNIY